jgi:hypothetical protein
LIYLINEGVSMNRQRIGNGVRNFEFMPKRISCRKRQRAT